jgi:hypothetical protein
MTSNYKSTGKAWTNVNWLPVLATAKPFFEGYHSKLGPVSTAWEISRAFTKSWLFAAGKYTNTQAWMSNFVLPRNPREYEQEGVRLT